MHRPAKASAMKFPHRSHHCTVLILTLIAAQSLMFSSADGRCNTIEAAFTFTHGREEGDGTPYFLSGDEYIEFSLYHQSEAEVGPIRELGLDSRVHDPDAAFTLPDGRVVFLKGCQHVIYSPQDGGTGFTFEAEGENYFGGLPCSPDAAVTHSGDILVFKGCEVWKFSNSTQTFQPDGGLPERGLACDLDAALQLGSATVFIKGTEYWELDGTVTGPHHTDTLNLCSWYLCGEADWMTQRNRGHLRCNGDSRLCDLRVDQVTLPGLHNAGSGFHGGFGFLDCWVRNHGRSILEQLELGIRYLDIDSSFSKCGLVGSHHSTFCGGSVCRMIKQTRTFLSRNLHEVVVLTFNHEMEDPDKVIPRLTRQLKSQLRPMLNKRFRSSRQQRWPTLRQAVRTNKRVLVFYSPVVNNAPFAERQYTRNRWIHTENWVGSTWRPFTVLGGGDCSGIVALTESRCNVRQHRELVEVSIVPTATLSSCVSTLASQCKHFHHEALRACQTYRYSHNRSPNVLLVDYPEMDPVGPNSVFQAVQHQNIRNIYTHRRDHCQVRVDAAVRNPLSDNQVLFFVGSNVITYDHSNRAQISRRTIAGVLPLDAAYISEEGTIIVTRGCQWMSLNSSSLLPLSSQWSNISSCHSFFDAAERLNGVLTVYQGCQVTSPGVTPTSLTQLGLPCDMDAALNFGGKTYLFQGNNYWVRERVETDFIYGGSTLDWTIDAVICQ